MAAFTLIIGNKNYSSWSLRSWLVMKQAGLEFEEIRILLDRPETRDRLLHYSPSGRVPVLQHGDLTIWESLAICEYLAELVPAAQLYPAAPEARAIARAVSCEMHAGFAKLRTHMPMDCRARHTDLGVAPDVQADIDRVTAIWRDCRQRFGGSGDLLFGDFSIADAMYAPVVSRFITYGVTLDPVCQAYTDALWALPAMQDWLTAAAAEVESIPHH